MGVVVGVVGVVIGVVGVVTGTVGVVTGVAGGVIPGVVGVVIGVVGGVIVGVVGVVMGVVGVGVVMGFTVVVGGGSAVMGGAKGVGGGIVVSFPNRAGLFSVLSFFSKRFLDPETKCSELESSTSFPYPKEVPERTQSRTHRRLKSRAINGDIPELNESTLQYPTLP